MEGLQDFFQSIYFYGTASFIAGGTLAILVRTIDRFRNPSYRPRMQVGVPIAGIVSASYLSHLPGWTYAPNIILGLAGNYLGNRLMDRFTDERASLEDSIQ